MNKRKPDEEFASINLSYIAETGEETIVFCPESKKAAATQNPARPGDPETIDVQEPQVEETASLFEQGVEPVTPETSTELEERHFTIFYGETGHTYESIIGPYLQGTKKVDVEDPYIRQIHQTTNFVRFCEMLVKVPSIRAIELTTSYEYEEHVGEVTERLEDLKQSLFDVDIVFNFNFNQNMHDREIRLDNGWVIKIGRGLDFYQPPANWFEVGANDLTLRKCLETKVDIYRD